jgi:hypothetical protein
MTTPVVYDRAKGHLVSNVLLNTGWIAFNEAKWGLSAHHIVFGEEQSTGTFARAVLYLNAAGKVRTPKRTPYQAITFRPTPSQAPQKIERQWLEASAFLAAEMRRFGLGGAVSLDPTIVDARSWQWAGYRAEARYTYVMDLPYSLQTATNAVRKNIRKAERAGYCCERAENAAEVFACLEETQQRQSFDYGLTVRDLDDLRARMGDEHFRMYVTRDSSRRVVSSRVVLHAPGATALDWVAGTRSDHLQQGVTQLLIRYVLDDLTGAGAPAFDDGGANSPNVYTIKPRNLRTIAHDSTGFLTALVRDARRRR